LNTSGQDWSISGWQPIERERGVEGIVVVVVVVG
jgi:hypothetical protein